MHKLYLFLKGILIGIALVLPGLSGSLMAVLLGMYEEIVSWISSVRKHWLNLLILGVGAALGVLISAKVVLVLCVRYPLLSNCFFLGLVAGGLPLLVQNVRRERFTKISPWVAAAGFFAILAMSLATGQDGNFAVSISTLSGIRDAGILAGAGMLSCGLMMLPGVSGSVLLILLGQYATVYSAISDLSDPGQWGRVLPICVFFGIGALLGVWLVSKAMSFALKRFSCVVQWLILGLTSGTCGALLWVCIQQGSGTFDWVWISCLLIFAIGFAVTVLTARLQQGKQGVKKFSKKGKSS